AYPASGRRVVASPATATPHQPVPFRQAGRPSCAGHPTPTRRSIPFRTMPTCLTAPGRQTWACPDPPSQRDEPSLATRQPDPTCHLVTLQALATASPALLTCHALHQHGPRPSRLPVPGTAPDRPPLRRHALRCPVLASPHPPARNPSERSPCELPRPHHRVPVLERPRPRP